MAIQREETDGMITVSDSRLPKYQAKIWPLCPGMPDTRYEIILNADGVTLTRYSGKDYTKKNAEKNGLAWVEEMVAKHAR